MEALSAQVFPRSDEVNGGGMIREGFMAAAVISSLSTNGLNLDAQRMDGAAWYNLDGARKEALVSLVKGNHTDIFSHPPPFYFYNVFICKSELENPFLFFGKEFEKPLNHNWQRSVNRDR